MLTYKEQCNSEQQLEPRGTHARKTENLFDKSLLFQVSISLQDTGSVRRVDGQDVFLRWSLRAGQDDVQLVQSGSSGEQGLPRQQLSDNATYRPHVYTSSVSEKQEDHQNIENFISS